MRADSGSVHFWGAVGLLEHRGLGRGKNEIGRVLLLAWSFLDESFCQQMMDTLIREARCRYIADRLRLRLNAANGERNLLLTYLA